MNGISPKAKAAMDKRDARICKMYVGTKRRKGKSLQAVGDKFGLSRERVRMILVDNGIIGRHPYDWSQDPDNRVAAMRRMYRSGVAINRARAAFGHAPETAYRPSKDDRRAYRIACFWKLVDYKGRKKTECWPWLSAARGVHDYPLFTFGGSTYMHNALFLISRRHKPKYRVVRVCPRRDCANPAHIKDSKSYYPRQK